MIQTIYTTGYLGKRGVKTGKAQAFKAMVEDLNLIVCDIRYRPWSRAACWQSANLARLVDGRRYEHVGLLGNRTYREGRIEIVALAMGVNKVLRIAAERSLTPLLLCGCEEFSACHRSVVAEAFQTKGIECREILTWVRPYEFREEGGAQDGGTGKAP